MGRWPGIGSVWFAGRNFAQTRVSLAWAARGAANSGLQAGDAGLDFPNIIFDDGNVRADDAQVFQNQIVDIFHGVSLLLLGSSCCVWRREPPLGLPATNLVQMSHSDNGPIAHSSSPATTGALGTKPKK